MLKTQTFFAIAINTYKQSAIQICVFKAFALLPRNALMRKGCFIHSSYCSSQKKLTTFICQ